MHNDTIHTFFDLVQYVFDLVLDKLKETFIQSLYESKKTGKKIPE